MKLLTHMIPKLFRSMTIQQGMLQENVVGRDYNKAGRKRRVVIVISGSYQSFKTLRIIRSLYQQHTFIKVIIDSSAKNSFQSGGVVSTLDPQNYAWFCEKCVRGEIELISEANCDEISRWGDTLAIIPACKNMLAKLHAGMANELSTRVFSSWSDKKMIFIAPGMCASMWRCRTTQYHIKGLGAMFSNLRYIHPINIPIDCRDLAGGDLASPETILNSITKIPLQSNSHNISLPPPHTPKKSLRMRRMSKLVESVMRAPDKKLVVISSGNVRAPLEKSASHSLEPHGGSQGAMCVEAFLRAGDTVVMLRSSDSVTPFERPFHPGISSFQLAEGCGNRLVIRSKTMRESCKLWRVCKDRYCELTFDTWDQYIELLRETMVEVRGLGRRAMMLLSAATPSYYLPERDRPVHKMNAPDGPIVLFLSKTISVVKYLREMSPDTVLARVLWESDPEMLSRKISDALEHYGADVVVAQMLESSETEALLASRHNIDHLEAKERKGDFIPLLVERLRDAHRTAVDTQLEEFEQTTSSID